MLLDDLPLIVGIFLFAGLVKGVIGVGLPTLSLALLTLVVDLTAAMALMLVPSLLTNVYQALSGGNVMAILKKCASFMIMAGIAIWVGAQALVRVDLRLLTGLLGICLVVYSLVSMTGLDFRKPQSNDWWSGPIFGVVNGVLTGLTGSFVFPGVMYLQSIGLSRDELIQAMGILFAVSTISLGLSLNHLSFISVNLIAHSSFATVPAIAGMMIGYRIRRQLPEALFRCMFFTALALIGAVLVFNNLIFPI